MPITPLPQFEEDMAELDAERARALEIARSVPETVVVRFGVMRMIGEFAYKDDVRPGCGTKLVCRTHRGTELAEMLTSTCPNAGCGSSVTRKQMLEYVEASGGRQYPFNSNGAALRVAREDDLERQASIEERRPALVRQAKAVAARLGFEGRIVEAEELLGGERVTFYYTSDHRLESRELERALRDIAGTRADTRQVGARDEARLTADYERCGQYCCCKTFLKVLKPVSMKSAKVQKATLDPLKISGRCGRLMCCLRYEDQTYEDLKKNLPNRKTEVGTPEGDGVVVDTQILTQLALVRLDADNRQIAVPVEELTKPGEGGAGRSGDRPKGGAARSERRSEGRSEGRSGSRADGRSGSGSGGGSGSGSGGRAGSRSGSRPETRAGGEDEPGGEGTGARKRRRRRRRGRSEDRGERPQGETGTPTPDAGEKTGGSPQGGASSAPESGGPGAGGPDGGGAQRKKRRRRRRRRGGPDAGGGSGSGPGSDSGGSPTGGGSDG